MNMFRSGLTAALIIIGTLPSSAQQAEQPRTISTSGDAAIYVQPDEAVLTFGVVTVESDLNSAKEKNDKDAQRVRESIDGLGIEQKLVATDRVQVDLLFDTLNRDQRTTITGYKVSRTYMVTLKDLSKLDDVVGSVLNSGANIFEGVQFRTTELRKHRDNARTMAIKAAREKAVALAGALNAGVGDPRTINETNSYAGMWRSGRRGGEAMYQNVVQEAPEEPLADTGTMPLGQIAVEASVNVTFDLVPERS